jgi:pimeloyl-ACP methyl ester carboxylesterase
MADRVAGTANDIRVTRALALPLAQVAVPTLIVHGTVDRMVPFDPHATSLARGIAGSELLRLEPGEHVAIFTHRAEVRARVAEFLAAHP